MVYCGNLTILCGVTVLPGGSGTFVHHTLILSVVLIGLVDRTSPVPWVFRVVRSSDLGIDIHPHLLMIVRHGREHWDSHPLDFWMFLLAQQLVNHIFRLDHRGVDNAGQQLLVTPKTENRFLVNRHAFLALSRAHCGFVSLWVVQDKEVGALLRSIWHLHRHTSDSTRNTQAAEQCPRVWQKIAACILDPCEPKFISRPPNV